MDRSKFYKENEVISDINPDFRFENDNTSFEGFCITTNLRKILIGITLEGQCCEVHGTNIYNNGLLVTEDIPADYIGSKVLDLTIIDELDRYVTKYITKEAKNNILYYDSAIFVNFETTNGLLQFTLYNEHNGYYRHDVLVIEKPLSSETEEVILESSRL